MDNITKLASKVMARRAAPQSGLAGIIKIAMLKLAETKYDTKLLKDNESLAEWRDNTAQNIAKNFGRQGVSGIDVNTTQQNLGMGAGKGFIPKYQAAAQRMTQMRNTAKINTPAPGMPLAKDLGNFISGQGEWGKKAVDFTKGLYNTVAPHVQKAWNYMTAPAPINKNISSGFRPAYGV